MSLPSVLEHEVTLNTDQLVLSRCREAGKGAYCLRWRAMAPILKMDHDGQPSSQRTRQRGDPRIK